MNNSVSHVGRIVIMQSSMESRAEISVLSRRAAWLHCRFGDTQTFGSRFVAMRWWVSR